MTNEEIIEFFQAQILEYFKNNITKEELINSSLNLARADERQKMKKQVCTCCLERIFKEAANDK